LLGVFLALPALAYAGSALSPAPADGQKVALTAWSSIVYEYPVGSGKWFFDGYVGNQPETYNLYSSGTTVTAPTTTIEYLDAGDVVVGRESFAVPSNVMPFAWVSPYSYPTGYFKVLHRALTLPLGAIPSKTRFAPEVGKLDPEYPKYHYGTAASTAVFADISTSVGEVDDVTLGDGRVQLTVTATNNTAKPVGPVIVTANEVYGASISNVFGLNTYDVTINDPAKALRLEPGESTTFLLRGLAATPPASNRYGPWNLIAEAEPFTDLVGTVSLAGAPVAGVTVSVPGYPSVVTATDGTYSVPSLNREALTATFSKPGLITQAVPFTMGFSTNTVRDVLMVAQVPVTHATPKVSGKASARKGTKLYGRLSPGRVSAVRLEVQVYSKKKYRSYKSFTVRSSASGAWSYKAKLKRGTYRVRSRTLAESPYLAGASGWRKVVVK
jgi:hypothetical protein